MRPLVSLDLPIPMFYRVPLLLLRRMSSPLNALGADNPIYNALFDARGLKRVKILVYFWMKNRVFLSLRADFLLVDVFHALCGFLSRIWLHNIQEGSN